MKTVLSLNIGGSSFFKVTKTKELHPKKADASILLTDLPKVIVSNDLQREYLQPIITQYFIDNKSEIWLLFLIAHSKR